MFGWFKKKPEIQPRYIKKSRIEKFEVFRYNVILKLSNGEQQEFVYDKSRLSVNKIRYCLYSGRSEYHSVLELPIILNVVYVDNAYPCMSDVLTRETANSTVYLNAEHVIYMRVTPELKETKEIEVDYLERIE